MQILLGPVLVGEIERFGAEFDRHVFRFDGEYLRNPARPVLGQLFEDRLPSDIETDGLTPWFEHLLPPSGSPLRKAIARDAGIDDEDGLSMLTWLGEELPGAVRAVPTPSAPTYRRTRPAKQLTPGTSPFRMSLAGNQWKLSLRSGTQDRFTLPVNGGGHWIAKFHGSEYPHLAEVEFATMTWAAKCGLAVPHIQLIGCEKIDGLPSEVPRGDGFAYVVERFDRSATGRIHAEDFGQIFDRPPGQQQFSESYEAIAAFLAHECPDDLDEYLNRLVFMVVSGNADAHLKNWALTYPDGRHGRLAPCYDLVATAVYPRQDSLALKLGGVREPAFASISPASFGGLAPILGMSAEQIEQNVRAFAKVVRDAWEETRSLMPRRHLEAMNKHLAATTL